MNADYRLLFVISVVNEFQKRKKFGDEDFIIPPNSVGIKNSFKFIKIPTLP